jgi:hypothetical protein
VRYIDPDGRESAEDANKRVAYVEAQRKHQEMNQIGQLSSGTASWLMQHTPWNSAPLGTSDTVGAHGCKATGAAKIASSMTGMNITPDIMASYADSSGNLSQEAISKAISDYSDKPVITDYWEKGLNADRLSKIRNNPSGKVFILARVTLGGGLGEHWVVLQDYMLNSDGIIHYLVNGTSVNDYGTVDNGGAARIFTSGSNDNSARKGTVNKIETYQQ